MSEPEQPAKNPISVFFAARPGRLTVARSCAETAGQNGEDIVLLLMWSGGCMLAALASTALSYGDGPLLLGLAAVFGAQASIVAGYAAQLPRWAVWAPALGFVAIGALGRDGLALALYLAPLAALIGVLAANSCIALWAALPLARRRAIGSRAALPRR